LRSWRMVLVVKEGDRIHKIAKVKTRYARDNRGRKLKAPSVEYKTHGRRNGERGK